MLQSISRFGKDAVGIEKTLKLLQSTSQIAANIGYWSVREAAHWTTARNQFALARRFFRLFKFIDCWTNACNQYQSYHRMPVESGTAEERSDFKLPPRAQDGLHFLLIVSKWSLLGAYLFLEFFTTVDAILGTWRPLTVTLQIESLKLWFYALSISVVLDLYEIFLIYQKTRRPAIIPKTSKTGRKKRAPGRTNLTPERINVQKTITVKAAVLSLRETKRRSLYRQLVMDICDALIPGAAVGWLSLDPVTVGVAGTISALVGGSDAWARVNS